MSWLFKSFQSDGPNSLEQDHDDHNPSMTPRGVKDDLSALGQTLSRQFRGIANFFAPPPPSSIIAVDPSSSSSESQSQSQSQALIRFIDFEIFVRVCVCACVIEIWRICSRRSTTCSRWCWSETWWLENLSC